MTEAVLLLHLGATLVLVGLIWTVQISLYPLFSRVGAAEFGAYHRHHSRSITVLVGPLMAAELATGIFLAVWPPADAGRAPFFLGLVLVGLLWASTAFVQVPAHDALGTGFAAGAHRRLVSTNWLRTGLWSARGALLLWVVGELLRPSSTA